MYGFEENPVHSFLLRSPEKCSLLPENTYHAGLMHFSQQKNREMIKLLISQENDTQKKEREEVCRFIGRTSMFLNDIETCCDYTMLVYRGNFRYKNPDVASARCRIATAMKRDKRQVLKICVKNKMCLNSLFPTGGYGKKTYFCWAATHNDIEMMKLLKKVGANVNVKGQKGNTLLHKVVKDPKSFELVKVLIDCGADVNQTNDLNCTPLDYAKSGEIRRLLIEHGADVPWYEYLGCLFS